MDKLIKLNQGIEGAEVRDALQWVKRITEEDINRMKIGRTGFLFSFVDHMHVIAGKVFIPSTGELWHSEKEVGFNATRLFNAFSIFQRRDKTELYIKEHRLFLKNSALKWRYDMEDIEEAQKMDFDKMPTPAIALRVEDILQLKQINKGKKVSEKKGLVAFKYGGGKATIFVADIQGNNRLKVGEVATEGEGEGIASYNLIYLEKLLKDAKAGMVRIEEGKSLKLNARTGKKTKVVLYLAACDAEKIKDKIKGEGAPSSPATPKTEEVVEQREEVLKEGVTFLTVREATGAQFHNPSDVYEDMKAESAIDRECVWVLHLNNQSKVMKKELVAMGTGNTAQIAGREIFRRAIIEGATSIIMVHNHPSGSSEPSEADKVVSARIRDAGKLIGIKLMDFMVIAKDGYCSFASEGLLDALGREE